MGALGIGSFWWVFLLLAFLPILIRFLPGRSKKDEFIYITSLPKILDSEPKNRVHMIFGIAYAAWVFLMIALMRPIYYDTPIVIEQPHRDIILAVDLSDSMRYMDMLDSETNKPVQRIDIVKEQVREFILSRIKSNSNDRIGIILFSDQAQVLSPLTFDKGLLLKLADEIDLKLSTGPLTNISGAINMAITRFEEAGTNKKILVLLTDGKNTVAGMTPVQAAQIANEHDMKIYTIGFGSDNTSDNMDDDAEGAATDKIDEFTLSEIAKITHGSYYRAKDGKQLHNKYQEINFNEASEEAPRSYQPEVELYHWPLLISLILSICTGIVVRRING